MGEESVAASTAAVVPSDRAVEQAIVSLKKGAHLLKYGSRGKPKFCPFRLSTDEKFLIWYSGEEERQIRIGSITDIIRGQKTVNNQRQLKPERESQSFSLIYSSGERSLDLICKDKPQADSWILGLRAVMSGYRHVRAFGTPKARRGAQSCIHSPAGYMRRKQNMGLAEGPPKFLHARSLSRSPPQSFSERCFSESSDSFYSASSPSSIQNGTDFLEQNDLVKRERDANTKLSRSEKSVLRDVFIWGEGVEGGCLDALLPKIPDSTLMLDVSKVSLGRKHAAIITKQGEIFCWGEGKKGRPGHKVGIDVPYPKIVDSLNGIPLKNVVCSEYQTCVLTRSGEIYTWGDNEDINRSFWLPRRLSSALDGVRVSHISCGEWHTAIVSSTGRLFTFGDGTFGALGHGNVESVSQPKEVELLKGLRVKLSACGPWHTAAIVDVMVKSDDSVSGKLFTWGDGDKGQLGHGDRDRKLLPTCVAPLVDHDFVRVSCGETVTVGLTDVGTVYTMGSAAHGQLGNSRARDKSITIVHLKNEFVKDVSSGSYHVVVLTAAGSVYTWGKGSNGQLGLGDTRDRNSPTLVEALKDRVVEAVTCGSNSTAAICVHKSVSSTDQSACRGCSLPFGFSRKKHNCYNCGLLFCGVCSNKKAPNASLAPDKGKPFRVCDPCFIQLQRASHSGFEKHSPRPTIVREKSIFDERESENGENNRFFQQPSDTDYSLFGSLTRWGHVPCPLLFRKDGELRKMIRPKNVTSVDLAVENCTSDSNKFLAVEVQKLKAQAERLEKLCETREEKIQQCRQRTQEAWSLAKAEAEKSKAAKEVIKALSTRLHTMSEKFSGVKEMEDQFGGNLSKITPIRTVSPTPRGRHPIFVAMPLHPNTGQVEDRKVDSVCNSPIVFSNTLKSVLTSDAYYDGVGSETKDSFGGKTDYEHRELRPSKSEWVEQYQSGVYVTLTSTSDGQKALKRLRFSRRKFSTKEAQRWWDENQERVCHKYGIEGYVSSNQD